MSFTYRNMIEALQRFGQLEIPAMTYNKDTNILTMIAGLHTVKPGLLGDGILDDGHPFVSIGLEPAIPFRYVTLIKKLQKMNEEQLDSDVTVHDFAVDEFYPVLGLEVRSGCPYLVYAL